MANTSASLSEVAVANMAGSIVGERALTTLDDPGPFAALVGREFGFIRDELSRAFPWNFLKTRVLLASTGVAPAFGWSYAYTMPADWVKLLPLRVNGWLNAQEVPHEFESGTILTDASGPLKVRYIRRETNAALFDPLFARALGCRIAVVAASKVTGKEGYTQKAATAYSMAMAEAAHINSLEVGTVESYGESIFDVRGMSSYGSASSSSQLYTW